MHTFYILVIFFAILIAYAGWEETMKLITYAELQVKYAYVRFRMYLMKRRLERELNLPAKNWSDF